MHRGRGHQSYIVPPTLADKNVRVIRTYADVNAPKPFPECETPESPLVQWPWLPYATPHNSISLSFLNYGVQYIPQCCSTWKK